MLRSPAMRVLSLSGRRILDRLEIELADHGGRENGALICTWDDFVRFGIHRHAITEALAEVQALGFVVVTRKGRAGNREFRAATQYRLTYRNTADASPTDDWNSIGTLDLAELVASRARAGSRGQAKRNKRPVTVSAADSDGFRTKTGNS
jgi:hypothetical protein